MSLLTTSLLNKLNIKKSEQMKRLLTTILTISAFLSFAQDIDNDGLQDVSDNCKFIYNLSQADMDNDGIGDDCDCSINVSNPTEIHKPAILISSNTGTFITAGTLVTFTTNTESAGTSPIYQWKKNNVAVGSSSPTYTDNTLANGDQITCELTSDVSCATGTIALSNVLSFSIVVTTNLASLEKQILTNIYPNPIKDWFGIHSSHTIETIEIITIQGQLVKVIDVINKEYISVSSISSGLYLLKVYNQNGTTTKLKFIKE